MKMCNRVIYFHKANQKLLFYAVIFKSQQTVRLKVRLIDKFEEFSSYRPGVKVRMIN